MEQLDLLKEEVHRANARFYKAFEELDIHEMEQIWAGDAEVRCIHPGWNILVGWQKVMDSWEMIFHNIEYIEFKIFRIDIQLLGDVAWVTCEEVIRQASEGKTVENIIEATNLFIRQNNQWYLVLHQGSPVFQLPDEE